MPAWWGRFKRRSADRSSANVTPTSMPNGLNPSLCQGCQSMVAELPTAGPGASWKYQSLGTCLLCLMLRKKSFCKGEGRTASSSRREPYHDFQDVNWLLGTISVRVGMNTSYHGGYEVFMTATTRGNIYRHFGADVCFSPDACIDDQRPGRQLASYDKEALALESTFCSTSMSNINAWLAACNEGHHCTTKIGDWWPTRLLDLSSYSAGSTDRIRLVEFLTSEKPKERYITLSHCWGGEVAVKLLKENKDAFCNGFPVNSLPYTFRETVQVTRALGVRYLWIDALCIIQDSEEDWGRESSLMQEVYSQCYLNIAATASQDSSQGLFRTRLADFVNPFSVIMARKPTKRSPGGKSWDRYSCHSSDEFDSLVDDAPLNKRAWVLQERLLSPRTLHFTATEVVFECSSQLASDTFPHGIPWPCFRSVPKGLESVTTLNRTFSPLSARVASTPLSAEKSNTADLMDWRMLIRHYTKGRLTHLTDRSVAISGLARGIQRREGLQPHDYVAGLWRNTILAGLLWEAFGISTTRIPNMPTWSWLSVDAAIDYALDTRSECCCRFRQINRREDEDPFGPVQHIMLTLCAPLLSLSIVRYDQPHLDQFQFFKIWYADVIISLNWDLPIELVANVFIMPLDTREGHDRPEPLTFARGLLLELEDQAERVFKRIGYCDVSLRTREDSLSPFDEQLQVDSKLCAFEQIADESTWQTINLV